MTTEIEHLMSLMTQGKFQDAIDKAKKIIGTGPAPLESATCNYTIGCALTELGKNDDSLTFFLEALSTFPLSEHALIAHVQDELARIQFKNHHFKSALFFIEMAITNFETSGNLEMKKSCEALREEILWNT